MDTVTVPDGTLRRYLFDLNSNRTEIQETPTGGTQVTVATYIYSTTALDQLSSVTQGTSTSFAYTTDGQVSWKGPSPLAWDGRGRNYGGGFSGTTVTYSFDATGRRRQRVGGSTTTQYRFAGPGEASVFETDAAGALLRTSIPGPAGDLASYSGAPQIGTPAIFPYYSGHGDLAAYATTAGSTIAAYTYDPFGAAKQTLPANTTLELWTGQWDKQLDTTSSFIQMGARPYDPSIGRFLAVDPIEGGALNSYDYAGQDCINGFDLDGKAVLSHDGGGGVAGGTGSGASKTLRRIPRGCKRVLKIIGGYLGVLGDEPLPTRNPSLPWTGALRIYEWMQKVEGRGIGRLLGLGRRILSTPVTGLVTAYNVYCRRR